MIKDFLIKQFASLHVLLFGKQPGAKMQKFSENVSFSFLGGISAFTLLFFANIIAARVLGPEEYGKYSVFFSIAQMLSLLYVLELDVSAIFFIAKKDSNKREIISSIFSIFLVNIFVFTALFIIGFRFFEDLDISEMMMWGIILLGLSIAVKRMVDGLLRSFDMFKKQITFRVFEGIIVFGGVIILLTSLSHIGYYAYVFAVIFGGVFFAVSGTFLLRKEVAVKHGSVRRINDIFRYNIYGLINAVINGTVKYFDKIIVVFLLGAAATGVYSVYFTASVVIGARITQIIVNVFFPTVRKNKKNIKNIFRKLNTFFIKSFLPFIFFAIGGVSFIVFLFGPQYQFNFLWVSLGGFYIGVHFFASLYGMLLSSLSREGYRHYNMSYIYGLVFYASIIFIAYMMQSMSITVFFVALIMYRLVSGLYTFWVLQDEI